jgi:sugar phosphate isomerase/epimerase
VKIRLGFDNYAVRGFRWKAPALVDYAASLKLDLLLLSDLDVHESLADAPLHETRARAEAQGLTLHVGMGSICPTSMMFDPSRGTAPEQLRTTIRVAKALGSPVARCFLGRGEDRATPGGIATHIQNTVATCKAVRTYANDSGVRIAIENHAGDLRAPELVDLIEEAGADFVGATLDSGNATWTLEDPLESLECLGPHALTTGIRDSMVWESPGGTVVQWVAIGDGLVDWKSYVRRFGELCPTTPFVLETISGGPRTMPSRDAPGSASARFTAMARRGRPRPAPPTPDDPGFQISELERSLRYCREVLGLGVHP